MNIYYVLLTNRKGYINMPNKFHITEEERRLLKSVTHIIFNGKVVYQRKDKKSPFDPKKDNNLY